MKLIGIALSACTSLVLLAGCASTAERQVERAIDAVGGSEPLAAVQHFELVTEGTATAQTAIDGRSAEPLDVPTRSEASFRRPSTYRHESTVLGISHTLIVAPDRAPIRSTRGGEQFPSVDATVELDHVHGAAARLAARVQASLVLPDLLLADDVALQQLRPVLVDGEQRPAVSVQFGDLHPVVFVFDPDTQRIDRALLPALAGVEHAAGVIALSDWRDVEGVLVAHERVDPRPGTESRERIVSIEFLTR